MSRTSTRFLLVRHGQSTWNASGRWQGLADPPLSALGLAQAAAASWSIGTVDAIVSSDLVRARQTAESIANSIGVGPVVADARFREIDAGPWTGRTKAEIEQGWPGWLAEHRRPDGFEDWRSAAARATVAMLQFAGLFPGGQILVVSHSGVVRALERSLDDDGQILPNLAGRWFDVSVNATSSDVVVGDRVLLIDPGAVAVTAPSLQ